MMNNLTDPGPGSESIVNLSCNVGTLACYIPGVLKKQRYKIRGKLTTNNCLREDPCKSKGVSSLNGEYGRPEVPVSMWVLSMPIARHLVYCCGQVECGVETVSIRQET